MEPIFPFPILLGRQGDGLANDLHRQIRAAILDGRLAPGTELPSSRVAARGLGIARNTVVAAYDLLLAEGLVATRSHARPVVTDAAQRRSARVGRTSCLVEARINRLWHDLVLSKGAHPGSSALSFRTGVPDYRLFPHAVWRRLHARALRSWSKSPFSYAPPEGIPELRDAISRHVSFSRAVACTPEDVVVTSGAQQAFDLVARLLVGPGRTRVAVEHPGYPPLHAAFLAAGASIERIPVDEEGLCVDALPPGLAVVCVTPSHQSPLGMMMSPRRRRQLLDYAIANQAVVVEDDYDGEFQYSGTPVDALQTLDREGCVFYVGTFSKSMFPALRKGFLIVPSWAREAIRKVKWCVDSHCDAITQEVLAAFISEGHLARHVRGMRRVYAERRQALLSGIQRELGDWLVPLPGEVGLHLAVRERRPGAKPMFLEELRRYMPGIESIAAYSQADDVQGGFLLGYGAVDVDAIASVMCGLGARIAR